MLQRILVDLLTEAAATRRGRGPPPVLRRQRALGDALRARGVPVAPADGINLWVPVLSERAALVQLAAAGIRVAPGSPFLAASDTVDAANGSRSRPGGDFVRVTVGVLRDGADEVADALASAAQHVAAGGY